MPGPAAFGRAGRRPTMRNTNRVVVFLGVVPPWPPGRAAPRRRRSASAPAGFSCRPGRTGLCRDSMAGHGARKSRRGRGRRTTRVEVVVAMATDEVGDGVVAWANRNGEAGPRGALLVSAQDAGQVADFLGSGRIPPVHPGWEPGSSPRPATWPRCSPSSAEAVPPGSVTTIDPGRIGRAPRRAQALRSARRRAIVSGAPGLPSRHHPQRRELRPEPRQRDAQRHRVLPRLERERTRPGRRPVDELGGAGPCDARWRHRRRARLDDRQGTGGPAAGDRGLVLILARPAIAGARPTVSHLRHCATACWSTATRPLCLVTGQ